MSAVTIRPYRAAEPSYVSYLQMKFYREHFGFNESFEYYLLDAMAKFISSHHGSQLWVAVDGQEVIGSIAMVKAEDNSAQLRWFFVDDRYQGRGIGKKLIETAMGFAREQRCAAAFLWTISSLPSARHLYEIAGFELIESKPNNEWASIELTEQKWELTLSAK